MDVTQWPRAIPGEQILSNDVHVWRAFLDLNVLQKESLVRNLSTDEVAKANRFHFERDRERFIVARGILRHILGCYLGEKPAELRFEYTPYGKPFFAVEAGYDSLSFNLSHSGEFALYAITRNRDVGIDIELVRDDIDIELIARRFFSQCELNSLEKISKEMQTVRFFQYWTRKEAFLKAMGKGVSFPMDHCDVSLMTGKTLSLIRLLDEKPETSCWYGMDLFPGRGYIAAIMAEGNDWDLSCREYSV
jgi:4'-phosphopantetheinyl transferase